MRPSNILVSGKSGSGKTEIFRQISRIYNAPFISVDATKYTEVGYHGEDVQGIIQDLYRKTESELKNKEATDIYRNSQKLKNLVNDHILKLLNGPGYSQHRDFEDQLEQLRSGELDDFSCFVYMPESQSKYAVVEEGKINKKYASFENQLMNFQQLKVKDIRTQLYDFYASELLKNMNTEEFLKREIETKSIIVIDEIDKLVRAGDYGQSTKASDEGVQYDLLPILDGTTVSCNSNKVKINTRNILFVGVGAFEKAKTSDLAIELQGRLPVHAKMQSLTKEDFVKILKETKHNLLVQAIELIKIEQVNLAFEEEAIDEIAQVSVELNVEDNIGARRLRTVVDAIMEDLNFEAPDFEEKDATIVIGKEYVRETTKHLFQNKDLKKYLM
uniref:Uncharacterized protein n=1 Tax=Strombidium rassoulzadegani TaxID=1082188 RepID=A0A7S3CPT0_9SPIT|mmetsp:Transcript_17374/g.29223  ORF Transcript_17374/g.29223 Transcript_17374/m.29223 type:complete len:387 (+) Transcript_17374:558-1718(+)